MQTMRVMVMVVVVAFVGLCASVAGAALPAEDAGQLGEAQRLLQGGDYAEAAAALEDLLERQPGLGAAYRLLGHAYFGLSREGDARDALEQAVGAGEITPDAIGRMLEIDRGADEGRGLAVLVELGLLSLLEPDEPRWRLLYGAELAERGASEEAAGVYVSLLESDPGNRAALLRLANVRLGQGRGAEAVALFETAYYLGEAGGGEVDTAGLAATIAGLWSEAGDSGAALVWHERAYPVLGDAPERVGLERAGLLMAVEDFAGAADVAGALAESDHPETAGAAEMLLGRIAVERGREDVAAEHWKRAMEIGGTEAAGGAGAAEAQVLAFLGGRAFNEGAYGEAAQYLSRRIEVGGVDREMLRFLVMSLIQNGEKEAAWERLREYHEHFGGDDAEEMVGMWVRMGMGDGGMGDRR